MALKNYFTLIERIDYLVQYKATGTPNEMATKLQMSRRNWFYLLEQLINDLAFPIAYDRRLKSYYYFDTAPDLSLIFKQLRKDPPQRTNMFGEANVWLLMCYMIF